MGERGPGNNVIYFDQHFHNDGFKAKCSEIYNDTELFKMSTSGAFILATTIRQLNMVLNQIKELVDTGCKFDLISTGSSSEEVMKLLKSHNFTEIVKRVCLFTYHPDKYKNMNTKYPLIKGVFLYQKDVISFLKEEEYSTEIFSSLQIVTLKDYQTKHKELHKIIALNYGNNSISDYNKALEKAKYFMAHSGHYQLRIDPEEGDTKIQSMLKALALFKDIDKNYKLIINNYTKEKGSIYKDFNYLMLRLNKKGIEGFGWFMAGLMYSLDKYAKTDKKGLKEHRYLYRGMRLDIIEALNYERMEGQFITYPSFLSTFLIVDRAADPSNYGGRAVAVDNRVIEGKFSVVFTLHYRNNKNVLYNTVEISGISDYKSEAECVFLPFSFFKVLDVKIDLDNYEVDVELDCLSRNKIIEEKIKKGGSLDFSKDLVQLKDIIMVPKFKPKTAKK